MEIPLCKCGCGNFVRWNKQKKWNIYVYGHNIIKSPLPSWNKGLTKKIEAQRKVTKKGKRIRKGHKLSEEHKRKIRESTKIAMNRPNIKEKLEKLKGEKCSAWKGGVSFEPYGLDFSKQFKEKIKERDNYCCILCNLFEEYARKLYRKSLTIHHIDYIKINNFPQNCISLCVKCHMMTNGNREHWKIFFQNLLKERYGYEYTQDQKIILDFIKSNKNLGNRRF